LDFLTESIKEEVLPLSHTDDVVALAFSPDGNFLASGSKDKSIRVFIMLKNPELREQVP
jgi:WD40 repeat protein